MKRELIRLKERAKRRPFRVLGLAFLVALATYYYKERKKPPYRAYVVLRVTEGQIVQEVSPLAGRDLDEYLQSVAMTNRQIFDIIERHGLYVTDRARGEAHAVGEFRENMKLTSVNNYFTLSAGYYSGPRTARITVRFQDPSISTAFAVTQDLAATIEENEQARREIESSRLALIAEKALERARAQTLALSEERSRIQIKLEEVLADPELRDNRELVAGLRVDESRLLARQERADLLMARSERQKRALDLAAAADAADLGLRFDVVDVIPPVPRDEPSFARHALWVLAFFLLALPLSAIGIGAFDSRLHNRDDVARLELPVVGHVPSFRGDSVGSLRWRRRAAHRVK